MSASSSTTPQIIIQQEEKNPRGIPKALFISDVEEYVGGPDAAVEVVLSALQDALAKYRYMDTNLTQRRRGLEEKIPDIKKTLSMVEFLRDRREGRRAEASDVDDPGDSADIASENPAPVRTTFELADTLYAEAELEETDTVYLWLGANVMLSYKIPAAIELLKSKLEAANTTLNNSIEDLEFIREQMTVMEVNTARVYNWDVKRRRERREKERPIGEKSAET
ncbi:Prefoldin subunit-domain-containing protein [Multifurca ochricompacta]|uniref:Prefoldin subunit 3 n=1 Tax=Multifurca ochricompacta TaxID=376703 RepID=A0AAD4M2G4_9AGAM|nr:Prefoldin subunit-domain-containing protein [Multifurca ochricompacta]